MNNWKSTFKYCSGQWRTMESKTLRTTDIGDNQGKKYKGPQQDINVLYVQCVINQSCL